MAKFNVDKTEQATMDVLKDFQRMTVERIYHLFKNGQNRVLVADEVLDSVSMRAMTSLRLSTYAPISALQTRIFESFACRTPQPLRE